jgi:hypothetical protein
VRWYSRIGAGLLTLAFRVCLLARRRVPPGWRDLLDAALGQHIALRVERDVQLAAVSFPDEVRVGGHDLRALAHAIAHALLHTWKTGIWVCHPDDPRPEERQAKAFARELLGEDAQKAGEKPPQTRQEFHRGALRGSGVPSHTNPALTGAPASLLDAP